MSLLRTLLILGRVSNLPTVWSNCLAGWWLGGAGNLEKLPFLLAGTMFLYIGGMFLNDAFDVEFDRQHRTERPIPSGAIMPGAVWRWGLGWLALGVLSLLWLGKLTGGLGLALSLCIVLYDAIHKRVSFGPMLMGMCRFFVYVIAASAACNGVTGWPMWCGLALGLYVIGVSYQARAESTQGALRYWPVLLLGAPIVLALIMNTQSFRQAALLLSIVFGLWVIICLRYSVWSAERDLGRTVSGLLAGIVFVDWLAVGPDAPRTLSVALIALFVMALGLQRFVPAT
jgi:hypothetical protein